MNTTGFFSTLRARFERNRLGELLVQRGKLTPEQLKIALKRQRETNVNLGTALRELNFISTTQIRTTLVEQAGYRTMAAGFALFVSVSAMAGGIAKASPLNAVKPAAQGTANGMVYKAAYHPDSQPLVKPQETTRKSALAYPDLFGAREVASQDISAFKKWTEILVKLENVTFKPSQLEQFYALPVAAKVAAVNEYVNQVSYVEDKDNYGKTDYWATPAEFFAKGGDCEDFAIAKYALLKTLGIPEDQMRLAIVQDTIKNIPHAVLIVYTEGGTVVLDNQIKQATEMASVTRYKPIYSINSSGWWRHLS